MKKIKLPSGKSAVALLFCLGDLEKADPGFTSIKTGRVRIARPEEDEAGGLSVHAVLSLEPTHPNGRVYRMVFEDVNGFGRTPIQHFLRHEFKIICDEEGTQFERPGGTIVKTRPLVEIYGCQSQKLKDSLVEGKLLHVQLIDHVEGKLGFVEQQYVRTARRDLSISVSRNLPDGEALSFIEKLKAYAKRSGYESMHVRWREEGVSKPQTARIATDRADAGEALFVRSDEISLKASLPEISAEMSSEMIGLMKNLLE